MDDTNKKPLQLILFCILLLTGVLAQAVEFEHISLEKKAELEREFNSAQSATSQLARLIANKWTCDMYGVRSRLQVQRGVNLYSLKRDDLGALKNSGAQVVSSYHAYSENVQGKNERFEDQLRFTSDGRLISRLSLRGPEQPNNVIAYSVCR